MERMFVRFIAALIAQLVETDASQTRVVDISTVIQNHFAETTLYTEVLNDADESEEVGFQVMLPQEAFITHFEMTIDGKTYAGVIEEKTKAKKKYTAAKSKGKTAGLVEEREDAKKIFKTSVNVGSEVVVQFKLIYQQLLRKINGKYTNKIILFGDLLSDLLTMNVYICETRDIKNLTIPPILLSGGERIQANVGTTIRGQSAWVEFINDDAGFMTSLSGGGAFIVEYELADSSDKMEVITNNGYFVFFGPDITVQPRRIVFVLDVSGSMQGNKLQQMKDAMFNIINKLTSNDRIEMIKFSSSNKHWGKKLTQITEITRKRASEFILGSDELGGTQIWNGLSAALTIMEEDAGDEEVNAANNYIVVLTDGQGSLAIPTLLNYTQAKNRGRFGIHTISFGQNAAHDLLRSLAAQNHGIWKKITVNLDSALQIENFMDNLGVAAHGMSIEYPDIVVESIPIESSYGGEIMTVGRFVEDFIPNVGNNYEFSIHGFSGDNSSLTSRFDVSQTGGQQCGGMGIDDIQDFTEKAFGMAKVENALRDMEFTSDATEKLELRNEAINMSMKYKLVTPVTSLLVIRPEDEEEIEKEIEENGENESEKDVNPSRTSNPKKGKSSKAPKWSLHSDPHFVARLSSDITVCFNWVGRSKEVANLFHDAKNNLVINGFIEGDQNIKTNSTNAITKRLYVTRLAILLKEQQLRIMIDPDKVTVQAYNIRIDGENKLYFSLRDIETNITNLANLRFEITEVKSNHIILEISIRDQITLVVEVHHRSPSVERSRDHLDLAVPEYEGSSEHIGGVFGELQSIEQLETSPPRIVKDKKKHKTYLYYNGRRMKVTRKTMKIPYLKRKIDCWLHKGHFQHLLGYKLNAFKLKSLLQIPELY